MLLLLAKVGLYTYYGDIHTWLEIGSAVLKLTETKDDEPYICDKLSRSVSAVRPDLKICPIIYAIARCQIATCPNSFWFAWLAEYAIPLDKYMLGINVDRQGCIRIALYKQVLAAQHGYR